MIHVIEITLYKYYKYYNGVFDFRLQLNQTRRLKMSYSVSMKLKLESEIKAPNSRPKVYLGGGVDSRTSDVVTIIHNLYAAGVALVPLRYSPPKAPLMRAWARRPLGLDAFLQNWNTRRGFGVHLGGASGGLVCFDFESVGAYYRLLDTAPHVVAETLRMLPHRRSQSGALHVYLRTGIALRSEALAFGTKPNGKQVTSIGDYLEIELLSDGHQAVFYSPVLDYRCLGVTRLWDVPTIEQDTTAEIVEACRRVNERKARTLTPPQGKPIARHVVQRSGLIKAGDWFNEHGDVRSLLESDGWVIVASNVDCDEYRRPGKAEGSSAKLYRDRNYLQVFSTSASLPPGGYSPFAVYAHLKHGGDFKAASRDIVARYGLRGVK